LHARACVAPYSRKQVDHGSRPDIFRRWLALIAFGLNWLIDRPGEIALTWQGYEYRTSLLFGLALLLVAGIALAVLWNFLRFFIRLPSVLTVSARLRRRTRGFAALTRGLVAVGAGDSRGAKRYAEETERFLQNEPLALFLKAQAAQLAGDRAIAEASFTAMLALPETRVLGLRGLHMEARRRGDGGCSLSICGGKRSRSRPCPGPARRLLDHQAARQDWSAALAAVERNADGKIIDKATANRQRAVLKTAMALDRAEREPEAALGLAREAIKLAPDLVPAGVLAGRLLTRVGDIRKAVPPARGELATLAAPRHCAGLSRRTTGRFRRATDCCGRMCWRSSRLEHPEGHMTLARAALEARNLELARKAMAPIFVPEQPYGRPTVRACLLMADLEEVAGAPGRAREWLARASRAARDPVWSPTA